MKDSLLAKAGYDLEEAYFHKLNQQLIQKLKDENKVDAKAETKTDPPSRGHLRLVHSQESPVVNQSTEKKPKTKLKKVA